MPGPPDPVEIAAGIGRQLVADAIWHEGRCNWIGGQLEIRTDGASGEYYAALGQSLYDGTSGIAQFLAELAVATGDAEARRTALGAIRQALGDPPLADLGSGLYSGATGIAVVAARLGRDLEEPELEQAARELTVRVVETGRDAATPLAADLLYGAAGTAVGLLALARLLDDPALTEAAASEGDRLLAAAASDGDGLSWPSEITAERNLTGFSHGAAGIAFALLELAGATGEDRYAEAAARAFDYEQAAFDDRARNWPDYRILPGSRGGGFPVLWCHGAPGIALARLAALERTGDQRYRTQAEAALATTRAALERDARHAGASMSLCHGVAGNAEVLAEGARRLGGGWAGAGALVDDVAASAADRYAASGRWPSGAGSTDAPGLMIGLAGVGRFYLRRARPELPSVLMPEPAALAA
jgi:lantibiotic modifying enzyme